MRKKRMRKKRMREKRMSKKRRRRKRKRRKRTRTRTRTKKKMKRTRTRMRMRRTRKTKTIENSNHPGRSGFEAPPSKDKCIVRRITIHVDDIGHKHFQAARNVFEATYLRFKVFGSNLRHLLSKVMKGKVMRIWEIGAHRSIAGKTCVLLS